MPVVNQRKKMPDLKKKLPDHWFMSECDGGLYDTRKKGWEKVLVRAVYKRTFRRMENLQQVKATLRAGEWTWPGGYQMFLVADDGAAICFECVRKEFRHIVGAWLYGYDSGWKVIACEINYEDGDCVCAHCNQKIPPAYGDSKPTESDTLADELEKEAEERRAEEDNETK